LLALRLGPDPVAPSIQFYISPDWTHQLGLFVSGIDAGRRCPMNQILAAFLAILVFQSSAHAAHKIRIGVSELNLQFPPLALVEREILRAKSRISRFSEKRRARLRRGSEEAT
jgi:hypothetical protein